MGCLVWRIPQTSSPARASPPIAARGSADPGAPNPPYALILRMPILATACHFEFWVKTRR
jgi:hypothetical protein